MKYPYERIVIGMDFSPTAREALRRAFDLGRRLGSRVDVVHVDPKLRPVFPLSKQNRETVARIDREQHEESRRRLQALIPARGPLDVHVTVASGTPSKVLIAHCRRHGADLLILGAQGQSALEKFLLGSTAERCLARAEIPVLLVPPRHRSRSARAT